MTSQCECYCSHLGNDLSKVTCERPARCVLCVFKCWEKVAGRTRNRHEAGDMRRKLQMQSLPSYVLEVRMIIPPFTLTLSRVELDRRDADRLLFDV